MRNADFMKNADNVYRTENFIVRQVVGIQSDDKTRGVIYSHDTFFARTPARDKAYNEIFGDKFEPEGHRLPSNMYSRQYID